MLEKPLLLGLNTSTPLLCHLCHLMLCNIHRAHTSHSFIEWVTDISVLYLFLTGKLSGSDHVFIIQVRYIVFIIHITYTLNGCRFHLLNFLKQWFSNLVYIRITLNISFSDCIPKDFDFPSLEWPRHSRWFWCRWFIDPNLKSMLVSLWF